MKTRLFLPLLLSLLFAGQSVQAQDVLDGIYVPEHTLERRVIPYAPLREADVMWLKRTWRRIDLREKINHPMYYPEKPVQGRKSLFDVIKEGIIKDGTITAYDPGALGDDDMFTQRLSATEVENLLFEKDTVTVETLDGDFVDEIVETEITSEKVKWYELKEEWFFDRQRSVMEVRIIGICPLISKSDDITGEFRGYKPLFWIYFPEARSVFVHAETFNRGNDVERRTYEDIFWKRQFNSYVIKQSNVYDRAIAEYKAGLDALLEAEEIKNHIFLQEHDLWHF